jgi:hypothetical protein
MEHTEAMNKPQNVSLKFRTFFGACSWLQCAPLDGVTKNVVRQNVYPLKQAFKQDECELFKPIFLQDIDF